MIEYILLNVLISELKIYCDPDKFYGRSELGQYDEANNRAPLIQHFEVLQVLPDTDAHK